MASALKFEFLSAIETQVRQHKQQTHKFIKHIFTIIPHICHEPHEYICVNFFWPVYIFSDLTQKFGNLLCILP